MVICCNIKEKLQYNSSLREGHLSQLQYNSASRGGCTQNFQILYSFSKCPFCLRNHETQIHPFSNCIFAPSFWNFFQQAFGWQINSLLTFSHSFNSAKLLFFDFFLTPLLLGWDSASEPYMRQASASYSSGRRPGEV